MGLKEKIERIFRHDSYPRRSEVTQVGPSLGKKLVQEEKDSGKKKDMIKGLTYFLMILR